MNNLKYYAFDLDDNILCLPTKIHLEHKVNENWIPIQVSTEFFSKIRTELDNGEWRVESNNFDIAYSEFTDCGLRKENALIEDTIFAIQNKNFGPIWNTFIKCLIDGSFFMIITARGHEPETIKNTIKWIVDNYLSDYEKIKMIRNIKNFIKLFNKGNVYLSNEQLIDYYLIHCDFLGITSNYFRNNFYNGKITVNKPENAKSLAIDYFVNRIKNYGELVNRKVCMGFSDDDTKTIEYIQSYIENKLSLEIPIKYKIYHTKNGIKKIM